jgi:8-oxo-dGTP pyrophosphatase MutT (NUDIX family)
MVSPNQVIFRVIGEYPRGSVRTRWVPDARPRVAEVEAAVDLAWEEANRRPGIMLYDLPMCRLESFSAGEQLSLNLSPTTYKTFVGTNYAHPEWVRQYGAKVLANPLGVSAVVESADGFFLLGLRNEKVAHYPQRIHTFAGSLEQEESADVFAAIQREITEELNLPAENLGEIICVGLVEDASLYQPELIFHQKTTLAREKIEKLLDASEHSKLIAVETEPDLLKAAAEDAQLTPVAAAGLLLCGRRRFGAWWFDRTSKSITLPSNAIL